MTILDTLSGNVNSISSINGLDITNPVHFFVQDTPPIFASNGDTWFDPNSGLTYIYSNSNWVLDDGTNSTNYGGHLAIIYAEDQPDGRALGSVVGDFWYQPSTNLLFKWDGTKWALQGGSSTTSTTPPPTPTAGDWWIKPSTNDVYQWDGNLWVHQVAPFTFSATTPTQPTVPNPTTVNTYWAVPSTGEMYKWDGRNWLLQSGLSSENVPTNSTNGAFWVNTVTGIVFQKILVAWVPIGIASDTNDFTTDYWFNTTSGELRKLLTSGTWYTINTQGNVNVTNTDPTGIPAGMLWYQHSTDTLKAWDGTAWVASEGVVLYKETDPLGIGDLWYNPDTNTMYLWDADSYGKGVWVPSTGNVVVSDIQQANIGDFWYNPTNGTLYQWNGILWVTKTTKPPKVTTPTTKKPTTISSIAPTINLVIGDLWYNPDTKILYKWNGTTWVAVSGVKVAVKVFEQFTYSALTTVSFAESLFPYTNMVVVTTSPRNFLFDYGQLQIIKSDMDFTYQNMAVISFTTVFSYIEESPIIDFGGRFPYSVSNNRLRFGLKTGLISAYAIPTKVITNSLTTFGYSDCVKVSLKSVLPYSNASNVFARLSTSYARIPPVVLTTAFSYKGMSKVSSTMVSNYSEALKVVNSLKVVYSSINPVKVINTLKANYSDITKVSSKLVSPYKSSVIAKTNTKFNYQEAGYIFSDVGFEWANTSTISSSVNFDYEISSKQYVFLMGKFGYSIENMNVQSIDTTPTLIKGGETIDYVSIKLSSDESSPYWIGDISLANIEDYVKFNVGDSISLQFVDQTFEMIIDGKTLSRGDNAYQACQISLISPAAIYDSQFSESVTKFYNTSISAKQVVEDLLGPVVWGIKDWVIDVSQAQFTGSTPMATARKIVGAIGGLVESMPDGTILVRPTYPNNIPDYAQAPAYALSDSDLFDVREDIAPSKIINRVALYTSALASSVQDSLEFTYLDTSKVEGVVKAYPSPYRQVSLSTTNDSAAVEKVYGEQVRTETEFVEFRSGKGSTKYPIHAINSITWRTTNLGGVVFEGKNLTSSIPAESLLEISYVVRSYDFLVQGTEVSQFVLSD